MWLPAIQGIIDRRILVNYRADPAVVSRLLPRPFRPKLAHGFAMAGICLIRLKNMRPAGMRIVPGIHSENAAHRFAVEWDQNGQRGEGVFIPRRDSNSRINALLGGRLVPGIHHLADFDVLEKEDRLNIGFRSHDGDVHARVTARVATRLPAESIFASVNEASGFFLSRVRWAIRRPNTKPFRWFGITMHNMVSSTARGRNGEVQLLRRCLQVPVGFDYVRLRIINARYQA